MSFISSSRSTAQDGGVVCTTGGVHKCRSLEVREVPVATEQQLETRGLRGSAKEVAVDAKKYEEGK